MTAFKGSVHMCSGSGWELRHKKDAFLYTAHFYILCLFSAGSTEVGTLQEEWRSYWTEYGTMVNWQLTYNHSNGKQIQVPTRNDKLYSETAWTLRNTACIHFLCTAVQWKGSNEPYLASISLSSLLTNFLMSIFIEKYHDTNGYVAHKNQ